MDLTTPDTWCARAVELGADAATVIDTGKIVTAEWVRMKCLYGCDDNGSYRTCPPNSPAPPQTRRLVDEFQRALLLRVGPPRPDVLQAQIAQPGQEIRGEHAVDPTPPPGHELAHAPLTCSIVP